MGQDNSLQRNLKFFDTVKLGFEEPLNKEQLGNSESFAVTNMQVHLKNKNKLALVNNFTMTKKFLITKFDCN